MKAMPFLSRSLFSDATVEGARGVGDFVSIVVDMTVAIAGQSQGSVLILADDI